MEPIKQCKNGCGRPKMNGRAECKECYNAKRRVKSRDTSVDNSSNASPTRSPPNERFIQANAVEDEGALIKELRSQIKYLEERLERKAHQHQLEISEKDKELQRLRLVTSEQEILLKQHEEKEQDLNGKLIMSKLETEEVRQEITSLEEVIEERDEQIKRLESSNTHLQEEVNRSNRSETDLLKTLQEERSFSSQAISKLEHELNLSNSRIRELELNQREVEGQKHLVDQFKEMLNQVPIRVERIVVEAPKKETREMEVQCCLDGQDFIPRFLSCCDEDNTSVISRKEFYFMFKNFVKEITGDGDNVIPNQSEFTRAIPMKYKYGPDKIKGLKFK